MPKAGRRRRIVFCDCLDCQDIPATPDLYAWEAAAKQAPPPRSLVICLEGFNAAPPQGAPDACCSLDVLHLPHFDNVARHGVTFCAAQRRGAALSGQCGDPAGCNVCCRDLVGVHHFRFWRADGRVPLIQQLLGVHGDGGNREGYSVAGAFQGMHCVVASTSSQDAASAVELGATTSSLLRSSAQTGCAPSASVKQSRHLQARRAPSFSMADQGARSETSRCSVQAAPLRDAVQRDSAHGAPNQGKQVPTNSFQPDPSSAEGSSLPSVTKVSLPRAQDVCARILGILRCQHGPQRNLLSSLAETHPEDAILPDVDMFVVHVRSEDACCAGASSN